VTETTRLCPTCGFGKNRGPNFCSNPFHLEGEWRNGVQVQSPALPVPAQEAEALIAAFEMAAKESQRLFAAERWDKAAFLKVDDTLAILRNDLRARLRSPSEIPECGVIDFDRACDRRRGHTGDHCASTPEGHTYIWDGDAGPFVRCADFAAPGEQHG
jgi:hypothetical protein